MFPFFAYFLESTKISGDTQDETILGDISSSP